MITPSKKMIYCFLLNLTSHMAMPIIIIYLMLMMVTMATTTMMMTNQMLVLDATYNQQQAASHDKSGCCTVMQDKGVYKSKVELLNMLPACPLSLFQKSIEMGRKSPITE
jgi:hypothetical protein